MHPVTGVVYSTGCRIHTGAEIYTAVKLVIVEKHPYVKILSFLVYMYNICMYSFCKSGPGIIVCVGRYRQEAFGKGSRGETGSSTAREKNPK